MLCLFGLKDFLKDEKNEVSKFRCTSIDNKEIQFD